MRPAGQRLRSQSIAPRRGPVGRPATLQRRGVLPRWRDCESILPSPNPGEQNVILPAEPSPRLTAAPESDRCCRPPPRPLPNPRPWTAGHPAYDPADLLKLFLYGYLNRVRSSRRLEQECGRNLELMWLLKGLHHPAW